MRDARSYAVHPMVANIPPEQGAMWCPLVPNLWSASVPFNPHTQTAPLPPLKVYANQGRWIAECPDCAGAQLASPLDLRFMCVCCANFTIQGMWWPIVWPTNRSAIEAALVGRRPENQNWAWGESIADLVVANKQNGIA
jgi:hypothetical protein